MKLIQKQRLFAFLLIELKDRLISLGYEIRTGDGYRDPTVFGKYGEKKGYGSANSLHKLRLAEDIILDLNGKYLEDTEDYIPAGQIWESLHELCRSGIRFSDGNHFSLTHDGRA